MTKSEKETLQSILDDMYADNDDEGYVVRLVDTVKKMINYKRREDREDREEEDE